jgi:hypothetical protein
MALIAIIDGVRITVRRQDHAPPRFARGQPTDTTDRPMKFHRITRVDVPRYPILRLTFDDGFAGEVDFSDTIAGAGVMTLLQDPAVFARVEIGDGGRSLGWVDAQGEDIDFCADALRFKAEEHVVRDRGARFAASKAVAAES